jgi:hypothetical protein
VAAVVLVITFHAVSRGRLTLQAAALFFYLSQQFLGPLSIIFRLGLVLADTRGHASRILDMFATRSGMPDGSAVPDEFVPGAAPLVPSAPPPVIDIDMCDPMPPRANAACESTRQAANKRTETGFMVHSPCCDDLHVKLGIARRVAKHDCASRSLQCRQDSAPKAPLRLISVNRAGGRPDRRCPTRFERRRRYRAGTLHRR